MSSYNSAGQTGNYGDRVPGARRQRIIGYVRAANELRQSYQSQLSSKLQADDQGMPGGYPDVDMVRSGDEEMVLFPSYARKHIKKHVHSGTAPRDVPGTRENIERQDYPGDADYWKREWEVYEDANAVVDVDVRGWIYSPQKGPLTRRNRLLIAVARRLSGIPAPEQSPGGSRESSQAPTYRDRINDGMMSPEEEAAAREADLISQRGQREAEAAWQGTYSLNRNGSPTSSRSSSPSRASGRTANNTTDDDIGPSIMKRMSWNMQAEMNREELQRANEQLMSRLRPFMTIPLVNTPITVFFFNDQKSQSKQILTDDSGHFNLRAAIDFIPTKVRVLASENLSAIEDVNITHERGISLISDIDDTIKHSAIASGAKEIFKNTFIRELNELTIKGVREWYSKVAELGVTLHYVSNSPWQLFPLLKSYFSMAGLPPGSFHLKRYSGMLQGIFEPAAERKKGSLARIMSDFPERQFILVGDSGEADLEVYTDIVLENPGRVLGVFIRDVTTSIKKKLHEHVAHVSEHMKDATENGQYSEYRASSRDRRPNLPTRTYTESAVKSQEENLIDFDDDPQPSPAARSQSSYVDDLQDLNIGNGQGVQPGQPPNRPTKPSNLRSFSTMTQQSKNKDHSKNHGSPVGSNNGRPPPPPRPRRSSKSVDVSSLTENHPHRPGLSTARTYQIQHDRPKAPSRTSSAMTTNSTISTWSAREDEGYAASARRHLTSAYNALPALRQQSSREDMASSPPRRGLSSYPAAAARWATGASGGDPAAGGDGGAPGASYNKKEEIWRRRWDRSEEIMRRHGVVLRTWRVGNDVMNECVALIEKAQAEARG